MRNLEELISRQINRWNSIQQALHYDPGSLPATPEVTVGKPSQVHPAICVSHDLGSGAREILRILGDRLGYEIYGKAIIDDIARDLGVQRMLVDSFDEQAVSGIKVMIDTFLAGREISPDEYLASLARVLDALAVKGGVVLLGRGAYLVVGELSALNVLITAPLEDRVRRFCGYENVGEHQAREKLLESVRNRRQFIRKHFKQDLHDPANFDLTINTARLTAAGAADLILQAIAARGWDLQKVKVPVKPEIPEPISEISQ